VPFVRTLCPLWLALAFLLTACSQPRAIVRITNAGTQPVREVELDYGRMFGVAELRPGEASERSVVFSDPAQLSVRFQDAARQVHSEKGPRIEAGTHGVIEVRIGDAGRVTWAVTPDANR